jgi:hypothetical protein
MIKPKKFAFEVTGGQAANEVGREILTELQAFVQRADVKDTDVVIVTFEKGN